MKMTMKPAKKISLYSLPPKSFFLVFEPKNSRAVPRILQKSFTNILDAIFYFEKKSSKENLWHGVTKK